MFALFVCLFLFISADAGLQTRGGKGKTTALLQAFLSLLPRAPHVLMRWQCFQVLLVIKNGVATKLSIKNIKKSMEPTRHTEDDKTVFDPCYRFYAGSTLNTRTVLQLDVPLQPLCKD